MDKKDEKKDVNVRIFNGASDMSHLRSFPATLELQS